MASHTEPTPPYAVSPHHPALSAGQERALACALGPRLRESGAVVITACSTENHHLIELTTAAGPVMIVAPVVETATIRES
jgi:hypothetical protein